MIEFNNALVNITNRCDINCDFCFRALKNNEIMDIETYSRVLTKLANINISSLCLTGGEPLDHPFLDKFLRLSIIYGVSCSLITSAYGESRISKLKNIADNVSHITISVNSERVQTIGKTNLRINNNFRLFEFLEENNHSYSINFIYYNIKKSDVETINYCIKYFPNLSYEFSPLIIKKNNLSHFFLTEDVYVSTLKRDYELLKKLYNLDKNYTKRFYRYCDEYGKQVIRKCRCNRLFVTPRGEFRTCPYHPSNLYANKVSASELSKDLLFSIKNQYRSSVECNNYCF